MNPALGPYHVYHTHIYIYINIIIYGISPLIWKIPNYVYIYIYICTCISIVYVIIIYIYISICMIWAMNHLRFRG